VDRSKDAKCPQNEGTPGKKSEKLGGIADRKKKKGGDVAKTSYESSMEGGEKVGERLLGAKKQV